MTVTAPKGIKPEGRVVTMRKTMGKSRRSMMVMSELVKIIVLFLKIGSLCGPGYLGTHPVEQAGLEL